MLLYLIVRNRRFERDSPRVARATTRILRHVPIKITVMTKYQSHIADFAEGALTTWKLQNGVTGVEERQAPRSLSILSHLATECTVVIWKTTACRLAGRSKRRGTNLRQIRSRACEPFRRECSGAPLGSESTVKEKNALLVLI